ncbi:3-hydroxyacyl-CoA dehydrogenase type-2 [Hortaea werneckii]|nr:3-hydroxyacyl-CoA dehydrogenase type-2 [Hortaea werneckii]
MVSHRHTYSMDPDELDYLEKRGLSSPYNASRQRSGSSDNPKPSQPRLPENYQYHSQLTGEGLFGISAYGLIILCFLIFAGLMLFGLTKKHSDWYSHRLRQGPAPLPQDTMHIQDRTFIISGGAAGLGFATAQDLHERGGYIAILDMNATNGEAAIKALGGDARARFYECDITQTASIESALSSISTWMQSTQAPIGALIPAAGVGFPGKLIDKSNNPIPMENLDFVLNINLRGVLDLVRLTLPLMSTTKPSPPDNERGVIILVSSSAAFDGQPGQAAYAASKGAIRSLTLVLARDLASLGIRCMSIAPSFFDSNMTRMMSDKVRKSLEGVFEFPKRPGQGKEFAMMVRSCVENTMLNGECVRLDGATRMPSKM